MQISMPFNLVQQPHLFEEEDRGAEGKDLLQLPPYLPSTAVGIFMNHIVETLHVTSLQGFGK